MQIAQHFKDSVNSLVEREGRKGKAVESLDKFQKQVQADYVAALETGDDSAAARKAELLFLEGYMNPPKAASPAVLADMKHAGRKVKP